MFGIECFVSDHAGFKGTLKFRPDDFIVTEISMSGEMVSLVDKDNVDGCNANGNDVKASSCISNEIDGDVKGHCSQHGIHHSFASNKSKIDIELSDVPIHESSSGLSDSNMTEFCVMQSEGNSEMDSLKQCESVLADVLDDKIRTDLKLFAEKELQLLHSACSSEEQNMPVATSLNNSTDNRSQSEMNLGLIPDRASRTIIHKAIRFIYPHLRTTNHKIPKNGGLEIMVSREQSVDDFHQLGIGLSTTLDFIRFVAAKDTGSTFCFEKVDSKEQRTKLHRLIGKQFGSLLETKSFSDAHSSNQQNIVVRFRQRIYSKKARRGEKRTAQEMQHFTGFTLQKVNTETLDAIQKLARLVDIHPSDFSYAGIKDKKAVTTQQMAVKGVNTSRLQACFANALPPGLKVGNIHPRDGPFHPGQLQGNHFRITVRDVNLNNKQDSKCDRVVEEKALQECLDISIKNVQEQGFINYFGEQRFGASSLNPEKACTTTTAADVGQAMLQGKYEEAVRLILSPDNGPASESTDPVNIAKLCYQKTGSPKEALKLMPPHKTRECMILKALNRHGTDREGSIKALLNLPHGIRQMYVYSFCSLFWNRMASHRMGCYGYQVVEGDLVLTGQDAESKMKVHSVTRDDIAKGLFAVTDIVLPLPGNNIQYPAHQLRSAYQGALADSGLDECAFRLPALKLNIPGDYRKLFAQPSKLVWGWGSDGREDKKFYNEANHGSAEAIIRDEKQLHGIPAVIGRNHTPGSSTTCECHLLKKGDSNVICHYCNEWETRGMILDYDAAMATRRERTLILSFQLPASSYATMCLRELMKS